MDNTLDFKKKALGGYKKSDVEEYVTSKQQELEVLQQQLDDARKEVEDLKAESLLQKKEVVTCLTQITKYENQLKEFNAKSEEINAAKDLVLQLQIDAKSKAVKIITEAELDANMMLQIAKQRIDALVADGKTELRLVSSDIVNFQIQLNKNVASLIAEQEKINTLINTYKNKLDFSTDQVIAPITTTTTETTTDATAETTTTSDTETTTSNSETTTDTDTTSTTDEVLS